LSPLLQASPIPPLIVYAAVLAVVCVGLRAFAASDELPFLVNLFIGTYALRAVLVMVTHGLLLVYGDGGHAFADDRAYDELGWTIAQTWSGDSPGVLASDAYLIQNFTYLLAMLYSVFGHATIAAKVLNAGIGVVGAFGVYMVARELWGVRAARAAAVVAALFPSALLWSLLTLKDTLSVTAIALSFGGMFVYMRRGDLRAAALSLVSLALLNDIRYYVFIIVSWVMLVGCYAFSGQTRRVRLRRGGPFTLAVVAVLVLAGSGTFGADLVESRKPERFESIRGGNKSGAGTKLWTPEVTESSNFYERQITYLPIGLMHMLTSPLPWQIGSARDAPLVGDTLAWYVVLAATAVSLWQAWRRRLWEVLVLIAYLGMLMSALALIENNVATLVRHRAMLLPMLLALGAPGLLMFAQSAASRLRRGS
jgi:4-amino-4-deoxy-L-arabinose transferase-like glycosyltransferase